MGLFDKLIPGNQKPPPYSSAPPNNNPTLSFKPNNPYPTVTSPTTPSSPNNNLSGPRGADDRPLPPGWVKQWHDGYKRFFYVDTNDPSGPQSHWVHPLDQQPAPEASRAPFNPPPGPPLPQQHPYPQQPQSYYPAQQPVPMGYNQPATYQPGPPATMMGNQNRTGRGGFNPLLAGAGGLAGGMLLGSMLSDHHGYEEGYEHGYDNGYDNGFDNGDSFGGDFGGGDFGGGDFGF